MKSEKIVFVTGGDKGIGRAIVEKMSDVHKMVIFTYNKNLKGANEITSSIDNTISLQCDLNNRDNITEVINHIKISWGAIDILINNAGYDNDSTFLKMDEQQWDTVLDINLRSLFNITQFFAVLMTEKKWGRIINITSIAGVTGAFGKSNYSAAKAGIIGFTKSLSIELGKKGITVNAIAPGAIETDMLMRIPEKYRNKILENIPMGRFGNPSEVADLVFFLSSENASYITGQTIHINGGSYLQ